jgi:hypothetical protein
MSPKITADHLARVAIVYVRQSTMAQVFGNLESQRRQYDLASAARATGFRSVTVIDDDLGRSGSGTVERPGFERLWSAPLEVVHPFCWSEDHFGWMEPWQGSITSLKRSSPSCGRLKS